uniref:Uncharacterized protein n=1 Tax=Anguilla anguilla TaxID=7936 RepID=A0A0E9SQ97_ANGAN
MLHRSTSISHFLFFMGHVGNVLEVLSVE